MKVTVNQIEGFKETELVINCGKLDQQTRNLIDYIREYSMSIECFINGTNYYIPVGQIYYFESVDKRTYLYGKDFVFECGYSLMEIDNRLKSTHFCRISRHCIVNVAYVKCTQNIENHRMEAILKNGEHILINRSYKDDLKEMLKGFYSDIFIREFNSKPKVQGVKSVLNAGRVLQIIDKPSKVVVLSYELAELMVEMGLSNKILAVAPAESKLSDVKPKYREILKEIPVLKVEDMGIASYEQLENSGADFILGIYQSKSTIEFVEGKSKYDVDNLPIPFYVMESTIPGNNVMENFFRDLLNLGIIFDKDEKALKMVEKMRKSLAIYSSNNIAKHRKKVFVYDSGVDAPFTVMSDAFETELIRKAGLKNIFEHSKGAYRQVTWEEVASYNPEIILIHDYIDEFSYEEKKEILKSNKKINRCEAVTNNQIYKVSLLDIFPGMRSLEIIKKLNEITKNKGIERCL